MVHVNMYTPVVYIERTVARRSRYATMYMRRCICDDCVATIDDDDASIDDDATMGDDDGR